MKTNASAKRMPLLSREAKDRTITYAMLAVIFAAVQLYVSSGKAGRSFTGLLVPTCVYILAAMSLNLVVGVSGELSLGAAGFMCLGAFTGSVFSILTKDVITATFVRFPLAILLGGVVAAVFGFLIGIPVLRLRGDYLAIVTLAFGEIIKSVMNNVYLTVDKNGAFVSMSTEAKAAHVFDMETKKDIIKGAQGITGTPRDSTFVICFIVVFIAMIIMLNFMDSKQGRAVMASRDNRIAAEAMGVNVTRAKMSAFVMSAFFGGVAGVLYSHNLATLQAVKFDYNLSILILVFVVLGGMRKMRGVVIATALLYVLPEVLRALNDYRMLIYAIVLIVMMLINNNAKLKAMGAKLRDSIRAKTGKKQAGGEA